MPQESGAELARSITAEKSAPLTKSASRESPQTRSEPINEPSQAEEDEWDVPSSKSKKDKKKKKRQSTMDDMDVGDSSSATPRDSAGDVALGGAALAGAAVATGAFARDDTTVDEKAEGDDWGVSRKKSKKDRKKKRSALPWDDENEPPRRSGSPRESSGRTSGANKNNRRAFDTLPG